MSPGLQENGEIARLTFLADTNNSAVSWSNAQRMSSFDSSTLLGGFSVSKTKCLTKKSKCGIIGVAIEFGVSKTRCLTKIVKNFLNRKNKKKLKIFFKN